MYSLNDGNKRNMFVYTRLKRKDNERKEKERKKETHRDRKNDKDARAIPPYRQMILN